MLGLGNVYDLGFGISGDLSSGPTSSARQSFKACSGIDVVCIYGVGSAGDAPAPALNQHDAYVAGNSKPLPIISSLYRKGEASLDNDEPWVAVNQAKGASVVPVAGDDIKQTIYVFHVEDSDLDVSHGFRWISVTNPDTTAAKTGLVLFILTGLHSQRAPQYMPNQLNPGAANV